MTHRDYYSTLLIFVRDRALLSQTTPGIRVTAVDRGKFAISLPGLDQPIDRYYTPTIVWPLCRTIEYLAKLSTDIVFMLTATVGRIE